MKNDEILHKWINNTISEEELKQFKLRPEYGSLVELYKKTEHLSAPSLDEDQMLMEIIGSDTKVRSLEEHRKRTSIIRMLSAAAGIALLIGAFFFFQNKSSSVRLASQYEQVEGQLPDQSTFLLNSMSKLSYQGKNWEKNRLVKLHGEAYFEVSKGSTFTVETAMGKVEVLGTKFNVKQRKNQFEVSCQEGQVLVMASKGLEKRKLSANQSIRLTRSGKFENLDNHASGAKSWTQGITKLRDVSIEELIAELESHFDVKFESEGIDLTKRLSCNFPHKDLNLALQSSFNALQIRYEDNKKGIVKLIQE